MMLQMTNEEIELYEKLDKEVNESEKNKIRERLMEIAIQQQKELKDCPFAH